jgi:hypothetical protein
VVTANEHIANPSEALLAHSLYSEKELATANRHFFYKAWPKFAGRYIVATYSNLVGTGLESLPVEIAVVQYNGTTLDIIARSSFLYKAGYVNEKLEIDTANYKISDAVTAFGLRTYDRDAGSGFEYNYESLDLFTVGSNGINHIAGNLSFGQRGLFASYEEYSYCNNGVTCDIKVWNRDTQKTLLIVTSHKTGGYFDLLAKTTAISKTGRFGQKRENKVQTESTSRTFRWDGDKYQEE